MMKFKKFLAAAMTGIMMLGMVSTTVPTVSAIAAAEESKYEFKVDYRTFEGKISVKAGKTADPYVILEVCKDKAATKEGTKYTYEDNGSEIVVDLSFLKASKKSYVRVYGSSEKREVSEVHEINEQSKKVSMKYAAGKEKRWEAYSGKGVEIKSEADLKLYEYRTLYGSDFNSLFSLDQKTAEVAGTTIIVRKAAVASGSAIDAPAGAEAKVKIPAAPKAPKVTIDYAKGSVKLPKNVKIQVIPTVTGSAIIQSSGWEETAGGAMEPKDILDLLTKKNDPVVKGNEASILKNGFTLVVRTQKTDKKAESNPAIILIDGAAELEASGNGAKTSEASISWAEKEQKGKAGFELTTTGTFEYLKGTKWTKLKSPFFTTDKNITVRVAGDKSKKALPSQEYPMEMTVAELTVEPTTKEILKNGSDLGSVISSITVKLGGEEATSVTWSVKDNDDIEVSSNTLKLKSGKTELSASSYTLIATVGTKTKEITLTVKAVTP